MSRFKSSNQLDQRGIVQIIVLVILLVGVIVGFYVVQKGGLQLFKSKANSNIVEIQDGSCVQVQNGNKSLTCDHFQFKVTSPLDGGNQ